MNLERSSRFGDNTYAFHELVAELSAAFLCAELQITNAPRADHAQYCASWLGVLKGDDKAIFTAAALATRTVEYLNALQPAAARPAPDEASAITDAPDRPEPSEADVVPSAPRGPR